MTLKKKVLLRVIELLELPHQVNFFGSSVAFITKTCTIVYHAKVDKVYVGTPTCEYDVTSEEMLELMGLAATRAHCLVEEEKSNIK